MNDIQFSNMKTLMRYCAAGYLLFVVYGSLVPLDFQPQPLPEALQRFRNIRYLQLGIGSRADWVANILLFIPLTFLLTGAFSLGVNLPRRLFVSFSVLCFAVLLCLSVEFTQLFFPPRTVSLNDIYAETVGGVLGVVLWWGSGTRLAAWVSEGFLSNSTESRNHYLQVYLFGLFFYNVMPLDLTLSPVELYHKWNEGRIVLLPFTHLKTGLAENIYEWISEILLWIPVPLLWLSGRRFSVGQLWGRVFLAALTIEVLQLFVYSRVTDTTDILLAMVGGGLGIAISETRSSSSGSVGSPYSIPGRTLFWVGALCYVAWCLILMAVFWYPYEFNLENHSVRQQLEGFFRVPFYAYYYGTEFRALTEVIHKVAFFIPLGCVLGYISGGTNHPGFFKIVSYTLILLTSLMIESVQALIPSKTVSSTDLLLTSIGGVFGFYLARKFALTPVSNKLGLRMEEKASRPAGEEISIVSGNETAGRKAEISGGAWKLAAFFSLIITAAIFYLAKESSSVPYNVRELFSGEFVLPRILALATFVLWCPGFPLWYTIKRLETGKRGVADWIYAMLLHAVISWALLRTAVPLESLHDIVGTPVWDFWEELEVLLRFCALFTVFSAALFGSVIFALAILRFRQKLFGSYAAAVLVLLPLSYYLIVPLAATDNLTELMRSEGRSIAVIFIFVYLWLIGSLGSLMSAVIVLQRLRAVIWCCVFLLVSYPLGYEFLDWALEPYVMKYGAFFSALQFLLSPDRMHLLTGSDLYVRFIWAHTFAIALLGLAQVALWLRMRAELNPVERMGR